MDGKGNLKQQIIDVIIDQLNQKIQSIKEAIDTAKESRDNETKSSVGDKYETGRTMMQHEIEKNQLQLKNILAQKNEVEKIDSLKKADLAEFGSCIKTTSGNYFLSIGFGKVDVEDESWVCISVSSPIGRELFQKLIGDFFKFQSNSGTILEIF